MTSRAETGPAKRGRRGGGGFTLLEMIIVLVVLALVAGLVMSRGPMRSPTLTMRAAAADVAGALRRARGRAIALDRPVLVVVDAARGSLSVDGLPPVRLPAGVGLSAAARDISFAPDGSTSGGRVMLADGARRVLVGVDWLTGRVSIADAP